MQICQRVLTRRFQNVLVQTIFFYTSQPSITFINYGGMIVLFSSITKICLLHCLLCRQTSHENKELGNMHTLINNQISIKLLQPYFILKSKCCIVHYEKVYLLAKITQSSSRVRLSFTWSSLNTSLHSGESCNEKDHKSCHTTTIKLVFCFRMFASLCAVHAYVHVT